MNKLRILLTGGGTGGHIYPLLAVAEELQKRDAELFYLGPESEFTEEMKKAGVRVYLIWGGKWRRYGSILNFFDIFRMVGSFFQALALLFNLMPDAVFSKGGSGALPVGLASSVYFGPIIIHESDAVPGLANLWSARLARRIAVAWGRAFTYFPAKKTAFLGNPTRSVLKTDVMDEEAAKRFWGFDSQKVLVFFWGGSRGSSRLNDFVLNNLPALLSHFQVLHQAGRANYAEAKRQADSILAREETEKRKRYRITAYLGDDLKDALSAADLVVSRAGASAISEIALFGKPSLLVPLKESAQDHQAANGYEYEKIGAAVVIEEENLGLSLLLDQARKILEDARVWKTMAEAARNFVKPDAARVIAEEIIKLGRKG